MDIFFAKHYKIPFLISLVVALAVITLGNETSPLGVLFTFIASIIGMFLVDFGAILHAFIVDPSSDSSQKLKELVKLKDIRGMISFFNNEEYEVSEPTVKSVYFQAMLILFLYYSAIGSISGFAKAMVFSFAGNLLYFQMVELQIKKTLKRWFWVYKGYVSDRFYLWYIIFMVVIYIYAFTFV